MAKILVADDDQAILDSTKLILEYEGYEVETASNGDTVSKIEKNLPDVILLDIWLSGANGGDIAKKLKSQDLTRSIPIILFSANRDVKSISEESGADDYLVKPFNLSELLSKVSRYTAPSKSV